MKVYFKYFSIYLQENTFAMQVGHFFFKNHFKWASLKRFLGIDSILFNEDSLEKEIIFFKYPKRTLSTNLSLFSAVSKSMAAKVPRPRGFCTSEEWAFWKRNNFFSCSSRAPALFSISRSQRGVRLVEIFKVIGNQRWERSG